MWILTKQEQQYSDQLIKELEGQSDRSTAILCTALLEDRLKTHIKKSLTIKTQEEINAAQQLFEGPMGALNNFSANINLGLLMGLYPEEAYKDMRIINKIRVPFAHYREKPVNFETESIRDLCKNLRGWDTKITLNKKGAPELTFLPPFKPDVSISKQHFIRTIQILLLLLAGEDSSAVIGSFTLIGA